MPSDPSGVIPKGTLVRPAPDYFDDNIGVGGYWTQPAGSFPYVSISLFNDDPLGRLLKVYTITSGDDSGFGTFMYFLQGTPLGSFVCQGQHLRPDTGTVSGQIWQRLDHAGALNDPYPLPLPDNTQVLATPGFASQTVGFSHPLAIIPVGWSLVLANANNAATIYASFWWQVANE